MTEFPDIHVHAFSDDQKQRLLAWLTEWELACVLGDADAEPEAPRSAPVAAEMTDGSPIQKGDVRLLAPFCGDTAARPRYIAVTAEEKDGWRVMPFGRFTHPAVPGEWRTDYDALHLRVLCAWNCAVLDAEILARSWVVETLDEQELQSITALAKTLQSDIQSLSVSDRVGPPLVHPLDPRHDYLAEEREWLRGVMSHAADAQKHASWRFPERDLPLAAEDSGEYCADSENDD